MAVLPGTGIRAWPVPTSWAKRGSDTEEVRERDGSRQRLATQHQAPRSRLVLLERGHYEADGFVHAHILNMPGAVHRQSTETTSTGLEMPFRVTERGADTGND